MSEKSKMYVFKRQYFPCRIIEHSNNKNFKVQIKKLYVNNISRKSKIRFDLIQ